MNAFDPAVYADLVVARISTQWLPMADPRRRAARRALIQYLNDHTTSGQEIRP